jgi:alginate O-acetyltransferase complex protein AlgJ
MSRYIPSMRRLLAVGFVLILLLPTIQMQWEIVREQQLAGVEESQELPVPSLCGWLDGTLSASVDRRLSRTIGFRPTLVRAMNMATLVATSVEPASEVEELNGVLIGKENWLFEKVYIDWFNEPKTCQDEGEVRRLVAQIKTLQETLSARGKAFLFVISPSKVSLYPEYIPEQCFKPKAQADDRNFAAEFRKQLAESGVTFVDGTEVLRRWKKPNEYVFAPLGTHWSHYGCFRVWQEAMPLLNQQLEHPLPIPEVASLEYVGPRGIDADLFWLLNLPTCPFEIKPVPYPVLPPFEPLAEEQRPSVLFLGTSFVWGLIDTAYLCKSVRDADFLYYYQYTIHHECTDVDPTLQAGESPTMVKREPVDADRLDWQQLLLGKDLVVLEYCETQGSDFGAAVFCKDALAVLDRAESAASLQVAERPAQGEKSTPR